MANKPQRTKLPMLYDGTADAIKNIRLSKYGSDKNKDFTQVKCAERASFTAKIWYEIETGKKRCLRGDLEAVLRGLLCTEAELREEKLRLERLNHLECLNRSTRRAGEIREPPSTYASAWGGIEVNELYALDIDDLLPEPGEVFHLLRNKAAADYAGAISFADHVKTLFENLKKKAVEARKTREMKPSDEPEDD